MYQLYESIEEMYDIMTLKQNNYALYGFPGVDCLTNK